MTAQPSHAGPGSGWGVAFRAVLAVASTLLLSLALATPPAHAAPAAVPADPPAAVDGAGLAVPSGPRVKPGVAAGPDELRLLGQSTDVAAGGSWQIHLAVRARAPAAERLRLAIYPRLTTRTAFRESLSGRVFGEPWRSTSMPLATLSPDSGGGVTLAVPVDAQSPNPDLPAFQVDRSQSGLFPVQAQLVDSRDDPIRTLTTYLLFSAGRPSQTDFPPLNVSLSLDLGAPPPIPSSAPLTATATPASLQAGAGHLSPATVSSLAAEVAALRRHPNVPLSVAITPQTADALAALARASPSPTPGSPAALAASTLSALSQLVAGHDELLPATWVKTSLSQLAAAGLSNEIAQQFSAAASSLQADLHQDPANDLWVVDRPLDASTLQILRNHGAERLIVPESDLRAGPKTVQDLTVAAPAELAGAGGNLIVEAADPQLSAHFSNGSDQVLAANQLLAELAMIQLETPSELRGVAVVPPAGWAASPAFLDTLLAGLQNNPLLQPVTAEQLFAAVPPASGHMAVRTLAPSAFPRPLTDASTIRLARAVAQGYGAVLPAATATTTEMARRILLAESSQLTTAERSDVLGPVIAAATPLDKGITLAGGSSITLTARGGNVPLTILTNRSSSHPRVQLRLSSNKLSFEPFSPADGYCTQTGASAEACQLVLTAPVTTVKVPVEARTSGVFTLNVSLSSPDGSLLFGASRDTVRSTAVADVGVVLIVVAALGLGYWWFRNVRHGRRARSLVDVAADGDRDGVIGEDSGKGASAPEPSEEPETEDAFAEFVSRPAPRYRTQAPLATPASETPGVGPPVSPSRRSSGPT